MSDLKEQEATIQQEEVVDQPVEEYEDYDDYDDYLDDELNDTDMWDDATGGKFFFYTYLFLFRLSNLVFFFFFFSKPRFH